MIFGHIGRQVVDRTDNALEPLRKRLASLLVGWRLGNKLDTDLQSIRQ